MKKIIILFLCIIQIFGVAIAEEEISLNDILNIDESVDHGVVLEGEDIPEFFQEPDIHEADGSVQITITAAGDVTIGGDIRNKKKSLFDKELDKQGGDVAFPFRNVLDIFQNDDMTLVNFEGTLTTEPINREKKNNQFLFSAPPEYVEMLTKSSIEAVALENNHVLDHGEAGLEETIKTLDEAGIVYSTAKQMGVYSVKGVDIAMLSYQTFNGLYPKLFEQVPEDVKAAKEKYPIVITSFHWGEEKDYWPNNNQQKLGKIAVDAGADLVLGHHSHRINPIEEYKGKYIVYSLGNCSFAGNNKPSDMSTFIFQIRFKVLNGVAEYNAFRIIPARISSRTDYNDFAITPYDKQVNVEFLLSTLEKNGKHIDNPVEFYPTEW